MSISSIGPLKSYRHGHMRLVVGFKLERYIFTYVDVLPSYVDLVGLAAAASAGAVRAGERQLLLEPLVRSSTMEVQINIYVGEFRLE